MRLQTGQMKVPALGSGNGADRFDSRILHSRKERQSRKVSSNEPQERTDTQTDRHVHTHTCQLPMNVTWHLVAFSANWWANKWKKAKENKILCNTNQLKEPQQQSLNVKKLGAFEPLKFKSFTSRVSFAIWKWRKRQKRQENKKLENRKWDWKEVQVKTRSGNYSFALTGTKNKTAKMNCFAK